jgi:hypothetical protein
VAVSKPLQDGPTPLAESACAGDSATARKLACHTNEGIAREPGVSLRTVTLKLELIRTRRISEAAT